MLEIEVLVSAYFVNAFCLAQYSILHTPDSIPKFILIGKVEFNLKHTSGNYIGGKAKHLIGFK